MGEGRASAGFQNLTKLMIIKYLYDHEYIHSNYYLWNTRNPRSEIIIEGLSSWSVLIPP